MGSKSDSYYVLEAIKEINYVIEYTKNLTYDEFISDIKTVDATMFRLQQMIEKIKFISNEYKNNHKEIPSGSLVGFRNGIVHNYGKTDYTTVYEIIKSDIYILKKLFLEEEI